MNVPQPAILQLFETDTGPDVAPRLPVTLELPTPMGVGEVVSTGDRFEFAGGLGQFAGPTTVEVTDFSAIGQVAVRLTCPGTKFPHYASVPVERASLLIASGIWARTGTPAAG